MCINIILWIYGSIHGYTSQIPLAVVLLAVLITICEVYYLGNYLFRYKIEYVEL